MKRTSLILLFLLTSYNTARTQDAIVHIVLNDSTRISGIPLYVDKARLIVQPDMERFSDGVSTPEDHTAVCDNARVVPFADISSLYLERSSLAWLIGFPGVPLVFATVFAIGDSGDSHSFGGPAFAAIGGAILGSLAGGLIAIALHYSTGSDFYVDLNDYGDMRSLHECSLYPDALPPALQALE